MKQKLTAGQTYLPLLLIIAVLVTGAFVYAKKFPAGKTPTEDKIVNADGLDAAERELNGTDIDGLGNEFNQLTNDSVSF